MTRHNDIVVGRFSANDEFLYSVVFTATQQILQKSGMLITDMKACQYFIF